MSLLLPRRQFSSLSVKDLLDAREAYHVHLTHMENVVATAIGRYRFFEDEGSDDGKQPPDRVPRGTPRAKTLSNSVVRPYSWPCVMVFVDTWIHPDEFAKKVDEIVPARLYLADGRVVPTCVVLAQKQDASIENIDVLEFPENVVGGGYPSIADVQEQTRIATIGCVVSDGDSYYALTNAHVAGEPGREMYTLFGDRRELLGKTAGGKLITKIPFERAYEGFAGKRSVLNVDAALVKIENVRRWTSQVFGIGEFDEVADLNVDTMTLDLIGCPVRAFGAASGPLEGEIQALFYRYRSVGGQDQLADLLIGPRHAHTAGSEQEIAGPDDKREPELGRHGNSGALWFLEVLEKKGDAKPKLKPIALHWGGQQFVGGGGSQTTQYALASSLGVIQRELGVEIVRDLKIGLPETWGKTGHYKVAQIACRIDTETKLGELLASNTKRISYDADITHASANPAKSDDFVPLADVPDLVWKSGGKSVRGKEGPNHFADMDQPSPAASPFEGRTLMTYTKGVDAHLDPAIWHAFYESIGVDIMHQGTLPFRVWQLYDVMKTSVEAGDLAGYVAAAGVLAHYVGDACQPLHVSMYHDGDPVTKRGEGVHGAYETDMLDKYAPDLNQKVDALVKAHKPMTVAVKSGHAAAKETIELMNLAITTIEPQKLIDTYENTGHKLKDLFDAWGDKTAQLLLAGGTFLASLWRGAWEAGGGPDKFKNASMAAISRPRLEERYLDKDWAKSVTIKSMKRNGETLEIT